MKEKRFQNLSLALNAVLLIALFTIRAELADTQNSLKNQLDSVAWRLMDVQDQITDLSVRQREQTEDLSDFSFESTGLDPESHTLQADMSITLRRWTADTAVTLLITQNGQTAELPMTGNGGVFTAPVNLPVEQTGEVSFAANITAGGQTSREEVTSYSDLAMLLPLTNDGSGYGDPTYRGGSFQLQYDLGIRKQYGTEVIAPVFQVLKNGETVQTLPVKISESTVSSDPDVVYYTPASAGTASAFPMILPSAPMRSIRMGRWWKRSGRTRITTCAFSGKNNTADAVKGANMRNIALKLMYNGTAYHGWQVQKNAVTVCETLQKALEKITGAPVHLTGCGRTDAGVHAERYIANFRTESRIPLERLPFAINTHTPEDIAVSEALEVAEDFNAIGSCLKKEYTYRIYNSRVKNPFYVNRAYFYPKRLDEEFLNRAAHQFVGTHDFAAVRSVGTETKTTVRTIYWCDVTRSGELLELKVCADGFLYNMVRAITGTVLYAAEGKFLPEDIPAILESRDRTLAGPTVPPGGLYLTRLWYEDERLNG